MTVNPDVEVQVAAGRQPGGADVADLLTAANVVPHADDVALRVVVAGGDLLAVNGAVVNHQAPTVAGAPIGFSDTARLGCVNRGAAAGTDVQAIMQLRVAQHRVGAPPKR